MTINQAFDILKKAGGVRAARIITENIHFLPAVRVWFIAYALRHGMPVAKIVHNKWFYGLPFYTNKHTLDPRPDTETLVSAVISDNPKNPKILDLGTGTGCIIAAIVKNIHGATGTGVDKSLGAVFVACRNIKSLKLNDRVKILHRSFNHPNMTHEKFDVIVSNPPYIAWGDRRVNIGAQHDPRIALYADNNGHAAYESIAKNARNWITPSGKIYIEIGAGMEKTVKKIFVSMGWKFVRAECDLSNITRVLIFSFSNMDDFSATIQS
jgi:release factor glutamine methyltransferase